MQCYWRENPNIFHMFAEEVDMRSSDILEGLDLLRLQACVLKTTNLKSCRHVALGDNTRYLKGNGEWGLRYVGEGGDVFSSTSFKSKFGFLLAHFTGSLYVRHVNKRLKFDCRNFALLVVAGFLCPCFISVANIVMSDGLAEHGGAEMVLRDSLDGAGGRRRICGFGSDL